jgi:hypothetical protein
MSARRHNFSGRDNTTTVGALTRPRSDFNTSTPVFGETTAGRRAPSQEVAQLSKSDHIRDKLIAKH